MLLPMALAATWIFIPGRFFAGKGEGENVRPAVVIKIIGESEEVVGVSVTNSVGSFETSEGFFGAVGFLALESGIGRVELVAVREAGSLIPIRPGGDIDYSVVIEIAEGRAFGPELVVELI